MEGRNRDLSNWLEAKIAQLEELLIRQDLLTEAFIIVDGVGAGTLTMTWGPAASGCWRIQWNCTVPVDAHQWPEIKARCVPQLPRLIKDIREAHKAQAAALSEALEEMKNVLQLAEASAVEYKAAD